MSNRSLSQASNSDDHSDFHISLAHGLENAVEHLQQLVPILQRHGYDDAARVLEKKLAVFDEKTPPPFDLNGRSSQQVRELFDKSASALAAMAGNL